MVASRFILTLIPVSTFSTPRSPRLRLLVWFHLLARRGFYKYLFTSFIISTSDSAYLADLPNFRYPGPLPLYRQFSSVPDSNQSRSETSFVFR